MTCHNLIKFFESCAVTIHQDVDYDGSEKGSFATRSYIVQDDDE